MYYSLFYLIMMQIKSKKEGYAVTEMQATRQVINNKKIQPDFLLPGYLSILPFLANVKFEVVIKYEQFT